MKRKQASDPRDKSKAFPLVRFRGLAKPFCGPHMDVDSVSRNCAS